MGFEPTRAEPIGLAVQRLNHSATSSLKGEFTNFEYIMFFSSPNEYSHDLKRFFI